MSNLHSKGAQSGVHALLWMLRIFFQHRLTINPARNVPWLYFFKLRLYSPLQFFNITYLDKEHFVFENSPSRKIHRRQIRGLWWPLPMYLVSQPIHQSFNLGSFLQCFRKEGRSILFPYQHFLYWLKVFKLWTVHQINLTHHYNYGHVFHHGFKTNKRCSVVNFLFIVYRTLTMIKHNLKLKNIN